MNQEYIIFNTKSEAELFIKEIDNVMGFPSNGTETWTKPLKHPTDDLYLVQIDKIRLFRCNSLFKDRQLLKRQEAKNRGWHLGNFEGPFAREREKLEDIFFLHDAILQLYGKPNFPALRALILSLLSACYALRESLDKTIKKIGDETIKIWWTELEKKVMKKGELVQTFDRYMQAEKHHDTSTIELIPAGYLSDLKIYSYPIGTNQNSSLEISGQGAFVTILKGSSLERRVPVGLHDAVYEILVDNPPTKHIESSIEGMSLLKMLETIVVCHAEVLYEVRKKIEPETFLVSSINFIGEQNLKCDKLK